MNLRTFLDTKMRIKFLFRRSILNVIWNLTAEAAKTFAPYSLSTKLYKEFLRVELKKTFQSFVNN